MPRNLKFLFCLEFSIFAHSILTQKTPAKFCIFAYFSLNKPPKIDAFCLEFCLHESVLLKNMLKNVQIFKKCNIKVWGKNWGKFKKHLIGYGMWVKEEKLLIYKIITLMMLDCNQRSRNFRVLKIILNNIFSLHLFYQNCASFALASSKLKNAEILEFCGLRNAHVRIPSVEIN